MPGIANYSAWIEVDGKALPEYDIQYSDNGTRVTCWIPSETGKVCPSVSQSQMMYWLIPDFRFLLSPIKAGFGNLEYLQQYVWTVFVAVERCCRAKAGGASPSNIEACLRLTGPISLICFRIANLPVCNDAKRSLLRTDISEDDDSALGLLPGIGEITLDVDEAFIYGRTPWAKKPVILSPLHVHERAKKGIVHGTQ